MRGLIADFARDKNEFPSDQEFEERLGIKRTSILKYKKIILNEDRKSLLEIFGTKRTQNVKDTVKVLEENIVFYKKIRDDKDCTKTERMQAGDSMEKAHLSIARVMYDAPEYLYNDDIEVDDDSEDDSVDNNDSNKKYSDRSKETESDEIKSISD